MYDSWKVLSADLQGQGEAINYFSSPYLRIWILTLYMSTVFLSRKRQAFWNSTRKWVDSRGLQVPLVRQSCKLVDVELFFKELRHQNHDNTKSILSPGTRSGEFGSHPVCWVEFLLLVLLYFIWNYFCFLVLFVHCFQSFWKGYYRNKYTYIQLQTSWIFVTIWRLSLIFNLWVP